MKKLILFIVSVTVAVLFTGCGARDDKNEAERYPTYDTSKPVDKLNDPIADSTNKAQPVEKNVE